MNQKVAFESTTSLMKVLSDALLVISIRSYPSSTPMTINSDDYQNQTFPFTNAAYNDLMKMQNEQDKMDNTMHPFVKSNASGAQFGHTDDIGVLMSITPF